MMKKLTYTHLLNETIAIYEKKGSLEAYQFMKENAEEVDGNEAQLYNFQYALAAASDLKEEALGIMKEAILDHGYWYEYDYLQEDEDLNSIRSFKEFQELVELCKRREEDAKKEAEPKLTILNETTSQNQPILMALHGDQENAKMTSSVWNRPATQGYTLAFPQSSQIQFSDAYEWEDLQKGVQEIQEHVKELSSHSSILIGGFSAGCRVALKAMMEERVSVDGFVFVAPWLPEIDEWKEAMTSLQNTNISGYIICGDQDDDCLEGSKALAAILEEKGIAHELKIVKGLDHEYPEAFNESLQRALHFLHKRK
ncbi:alpha/beta hydrolase [Bacillus sp. N1-1]|jgi:predicted esterase|uniref:alpha/beta hydrolase n=1 Tax=Bacillus sp. N1-1 TaxID=2682541 RepID=UPI00131919FD|nr:alpha/beta hydrolase [Bacillus sp. N1-1]QHA91964.1 alpha/beta hydrolase [Bacillus sp. N1-1]